MSASAGIAGATGGTAGARTVMDGARRRAVLRTYAVFFLLVAVVDTGNVLWEVRHRVAMGHPIAAVEPIIWESSSAIGFLLFAPIVLVAANLAPPRPIRWPRFLLLHVAASIVFSSLHILTMSGIRRWVYALAGAHYGGLMFDFLNEYRKDIPAYVILAGLFWGFRALERETRPAPAAGAFFEIRDGARTIRARVHDVLAVSSAGNYVEVVLNDGRKPLMRSTLAAVEAELGPHGFLRTHRSWLVNAAYVRELTALGSGDFTVTLEGGAEVPLSRRFPAALQSLRSAPA